ncbi:TPA: DUF1232 domain-containing protein [Candidatus Woesearchaeota archaeon]|nr:DUF1232 domain-containing protein [Candidatus Woesearchaeota archaeon]HIH32045.1 DUF1232 domain-containing protein [Candidatus Woesearchaeota archaeon]HIH54989.1 DUF1232 domain-containing protein [Candidatus Woesearchaeota archaeon]HIJ01646.1 DUF1232 domain-containing protein [Candidatus Woesearchaeota archaeon]HIJ13361.1 DUF1232 domain-containing protein [Candidatus Woesearchaeota archaeon]
MKNYYTYLVDQLEDFKERGKDVSQITFIPEFFKLLSDMLDHDEVDRESRALINTALGYFVAPDDILPDDVYGPEGFMDDVFVCSVVMNQLYEFYPDLMNKLWDNPLSIRDAIQKTYDESSKYLEEHDLKQRILDYAGLEL